MVVFDFCSDNDIKWFNLPSWCFLSSYVSAAPHTSIISAPCVLCCIKFFHHGYYYCIKLLTTGVISVSGAAPWISCFTLLLVLFFHIIFFITLYWYPFFIALQHITIVIWATSGMIRLDLFGMILIRLAWMAQRWGVPQL